jgi:hypothetical protein
VVVPLFVVCSASVIVALAARSWIAAACAAAGVLASMVAQGVGHKREPVPPEPFKGPFDFVSRLICEQWVTFPRFVLSGGWARAWRQWPPG